MSTLDEHIAGHAIRSSCCPVATPNVSAAEASSVLVGADS